jgi:ankyrin repeat protein
VGHLDVVKWLFKFNKIDVNYRQGLYTPLIAACTTGHLDVVKFLIEICDVDINLPDTNGSTPLTSACKCDNTSVISYMLQQQIKNLDVNILDSFNNSSLHYIICCSKSNFTPLHRACNEGNVNQVKKLIDVYDHSVNIQDNNGNTPLHIACVQRHFSIAKILIMAGADETITNNDRKNPLQIIEDTKNLFPMLERNRLQNWLQTEISFRRLRSSSFVILGVLLLISTLRNRR